MRRVVSIPVEQADLLAAACAEALVCIDQHGDPGSILDLVMDALKPVAAHIDTARQAMIQQDAQRAQVYAVLGHPVGTPRPPAEP